MDVRLVFRGRVGILGEKNRPESLMHDQHILRVTVFVCVLTTAGFTPALAI